MLEGGEDPLYIARRLIVVASEDVGLGDPHGLPLVSLTPFRPSLPAFDDIDCIRLWLATRHARSSVCLNVG